LAISEEADKPFTNLHAKPSKVGAVAEESGIQRVVFSHLMKLDATDKRANQFSLYDINTTVRLVGSKFNGTVILAEDLACISL
jgi:ribonuclease BN (tRNA processing enzyme)